MNKIPDSPSPIDSQKDRLPSMDKPAEQQGNLEARSVKPLPPNLEKGELFQEVVQPKPKTYLESVKEELGELHQLKGRLSDFKSDESIDKLSKNIHQVSNRIKLWSKLNFMNIFVNKIGRMNIELQELEFEKSKLESQAEKHEILSKRIEEVVQEQDIATAFIEYERIPTPKNKEALKHRLIALFQKGNPNNNAAIVNKLIEVLPEDQKTIMYRAIAFLPDKFIKELLNATKNKFGDEQVKKLSQKLFEVPLEDYLENPQVSINHGILKIALGNYLVFHPDHAVRELISLMDEMPKNHKEFLYEALHHLPEENKDEIAEKLMKSKSPHLSEIIKGVLRKEIPDQQDVGTLFRTNSLYSKMMSYVVKSEEMEKFGQDVLGPIVKEFMSAPDFEIDPIRLKEKLKLGDSLEDQAKLARELEQNQKQVLDTAENIFQQINAALGNVNMPSIYKEIISELYEQVSGKFGEDVARKEVLASLMLRFISPAILQPNKYNVGKGMQINYGNKMPQMTMIAKILQSVANQIKGVPNDTRLAFTTELTQKLIPQYAQNADVLVGKLGVLQAAEKLANSGPMTREVNQEFLLDEFMKYFALGTSNYANSDVAKAFMQLDADHQKLLMEQFPQARLLHNNAKFIIDSTDLLGRAIRPLVGNSGEGIAKALLQEKGQEMAPLKNSQGQPLMTTAQGDKPSQPVLFPDQFQADYFRQNYFSGGKMILDGSKTKALEEEIERFEKRLKKLEKNPQNAPLISQLQSQIKELAQNVNALRDNAFDLFGDIYEQYGEQAVKNISRLLTQTMSTELSNNLMEQLKDPLDSTKGFAAIVLSNDYDISTDAEGNIHLTYKWNFLIKDQDPDSEKTNLGNILVTREIIIPKNEAVHNWEESPFPDSKIQVKDSHKMVTAPPLANLMNSALNEISSKFPKLAVIDKNNIVKHLQLLEFNLNEHLSDILTAIKENNIKTPEEAYERLIDKYLGLISKDKILPRYTAILRNLFVKSESSLKELFKEELNLQVKFSVQRKDVKPTVTFDESITEILIDQHEKVSADFLAKGFRSMFRDKLENEYLSRVLANALHEKIDKVIDAIENGEITDSKMAYERLKLEFSEERNELKKEPENMEEIRELEKKGKKFGYKMLDEEQDKKVGEIMTMAWSEKVFQRFFNLIIAQNK